VAELLSPGALYIASPESHREAGVGQSLERRGIDLVGA
jgi:hypothetical protein